MAEFIVSTQSAPFHWFGHGSKIHLSGMEEVRIIVKVSLSGQFQLPEDTVLLSPVYWISASAKITNPVTIEIQHCALSKDEAILSGLSFVATEISPKHLPYRFDYLDGGVFNKHSSYGSIQLSHFSGIGVGIAGRKRTPRSYCAYVYHTMKQKDDLRFYFIIVQNLEAHIAVSSLGLCIC